MCSINLSKDYVADDRETPIYSCIDNKKVPDLRTLRDFKKCIKCKKVVHRNDFYREDKNVCKACEITYQMAYRRKHGRTKTYLFTYEKAALQIGRSKEYFKQMKKKTPDMFLKIERMGDGDLAVGYDKVIKYHQGLMEKIVDLSSELLEYMSSKEREKIINKQDLFFINKKAKENIYKLPFFSFLVKCERLEKELTEMLNDYKK